MKHTVIRNPKRFYTFVTISVVLLALLAQVLIGFLSNQSAWASSTNESETHIVQAGETVWQIALPIAQAHQRDTRDVVRDIYRWNALSETTIHPGQPLRVPAL